MDELLTAKQVQDMLQIDRTTVYRMLDDGRLTGIKVGQQWRFPRSSILSLLDGNAPPPEPVNKPADVLPIHCLQPIQDVFAEVMGIGAVTTGLDGEPVTELSNACHFCRLMLSSPSGRAACIESWRTLANQTGTQPEFVRCHAGLQYARARIQVGSIPTAILVAGQFYADEPEKAEETTRIHSLADAHGIGEPELRAAAEALPRLDDRKRSEIGRWLTRVAQTFEQIGRERADLMSRLKQISEMSRLEATPR